MSHDVFIGHAPRDRDVADAARAALEQRGFSCWSASRDDIPDEDRGATAEAIRASRAFVLIVSAAALDSPQAAREAGQAARQGLPIVAFRIEEVTAGGALGEALRAAEWLDALTPPIAPHLDYLGDTVAELLDKARPGPLLPTAPPRALLRRRTPNWLPIALAGAAGLAAVALAAAYVGRHPHPAAEARDRAR